MLCKIYVDKNVLYAVFIVRQNSKITFIYSIVSTVFSNAENILEGNGYKCYEVFFFSSALLFPRLSPVTLYLSLLLSNLPKVPTIEQLVLR